MTDLIQRIENYLAAGGLNNPELMDHERVRDLIIDCRDALAQPEQEFYPDWNMIKPFHERIAELEAQLAQPKQEPVNTMPTKIFAPNLEQILNAAGFYKREWVGLTDEEIKKIMQRWRNGYIDIKDVEQLLKEKNT